MKEHKNKNRKNKNIKRLGIFSVLGLIAAVLVIHMISMVTFDSIIEYKEVPFHSSKVPSEMNGYKIAFISDVHNMPDQKLETIVGEMNNRQLNLLVLGGDLQTSKKDLKNTMEILSKTKTSDGIYGVEGNHENYEELFAAMEQYSIHPLSNGGVHIKKHFYLAGAEDLWNRDPDLEKALADAKADDFSILISHNPDVTMQQNTSKADLILSGHTHGGQITLFGLWAPGLTLRKTITDYGQRFMSGWAKSKDGVPVYVSNGAGTFDGVPRIFARPQVILLTLLCD